MSTIISLQNPQIKELVKLQKKHYRDQVDRFVIEGERETARAIEQGVVIEKIFLSKTNLKISIIGAERAIPIFELSEKAFEKVCYRENPDGVIAIAKKNHYTQKDLEKVLQALKKGIFLICVGIEKPGNLGSMLRSADAAGAEGIILCDPHLDLFNPNVVRASMGTLFSVPVYRADSKDVMLLLKQYGVQVIAATPHEAENYTSIRYAPKVAVAMGKEQTGLTPFWIEQADRAALIPMKGLADSLNVANAATLFLYEIVRQHDTSAL